MAQERVRLLRAIENGHQKNLGFFEFLKVVAFQVNRGLIEVNQS